MIRRKLTMVIPTFLMTLTPAFAAMAPRVPPPPDAEPKAPMATCNTKSNKQECCSAKDCAGKVLSNRDEHNCQKKSKGKSWHDKKGSCTNFRKS